MSTEKGIVITKKRELLPKLNNLIIRLAQMSGDVAKLELHDYEQASKRVRVALLEFKNIHLKDFQNEITNLRIDINAVKGRNPTSKKKETLDVGDIEEVNPDN